MHAHRQGLLLRNVPLDAKLATDPTSYSAERWNYKRTPTTAHPPRSTDSGPAEGKNG